MPDIQNGVRIERTLTGVLDVYSCANEFNWLRFLSYSSSSKAVRFLCITVIDNYLNLMGRFCAISLSSQTGLSLQTMAKCFIFVFNVNGQT